MIDPVPKCLGYIQGILQHHSGKMHVGRLGGYIRCNPFLYAYLWKEDYYSNKGTMDNSERKKYADIRCSSKCWLKRLNKGKKNYARNIKVVQGIETSCLFCFVFIWIIKKYLICFARLLRPDTWSFFWKQNKTKKHLKSE